MSSFVLVVFLVLSLGVVFWTHLLFLCSVKISSVEARRKGQESALGRGKLQV